MRIVIILRAHKLNFTPVLSNADQNKTSRGLKSVFESSVIVTSLVWRAGLTVEILKPAFSNSSGVG